MNRAVWKKCIAESLPLFIALALGVISFAWFRVHVVGELDTSSFRGILDLIPEEWLNYTSVDIEWLISFVGRTAMTLDEPFLVMMIAMWAIVRGSDVVSGEISRGTMEMLLSQPVSRRQVFVIHSLVTVIGIALLVLLTWLAMWASVHMTEVKVVDESKITFWTQMMAPIELLSGKPRKFDMIQKPMADYVDATLFLPGLVNLMLLGCFIASIATFVSSLDRFRWRTLGISVGVYMIAAMIKILGMSSPAFEWTEWLTFFSLYEPELSVKLYQLDSSAFWQLMMYNEDGSWKGFGQFGHNLILLLGTLGFFGSAYRIFKRRDVPAPL